MGLPVSWSSAPSVCSKAELTTGPIGHLLLPPQRIHSINHPGSQVRHWLPPSCSPHPQSCPSHLPNLCNLSILHPVPHPTQSRPPLSLWIAAKSLSPISLVCTLFSLFLSLTCMCPMNYQGNLSKTQVQPGQPHCPPQPGLGDWGDFPTHLTEVGTEQLKPWAPDQPGLGLHPGWAVW